MAIQLITLDNTQLGRLIKKIYDRVVKKSETTEVQSVGIDNTPTLNSQNLVLSGGVASALAEKYTKPLTGIPASDLADGVIPAVPTDIVKYTEQSLTAEQKAQARTNIEAEREILHVTAGYEQDGETISADKTYDEISAAVADGKDVVVDALVLGFMKFRYVGYFFAFYFACWFDAKMYVLSVSDNEGADKWRLSAYNPEFTDNKVTTISSSSSDKQYPSAKAVYTELAKKQPTIDANHKLDYSLLSNTPTIPTTYAGSPTAGGFANKAVGIPFGSVDSDSTATNIKATVDNFPDTLTDGVCAYIRNNAVASASGFTLNINGTGAKPVYQTMADASRSTTIFAATTTYLFVYNSSRVEGGCWDIYYGYNSNDNTIGYILRTNYMSLPVTSACYRYRLLFTSADGDHFVPANASSSTSATATKTTTQTPIDPFGSIRYYNYTSAVSRGARPGAAYLCEQYQVTLGYSFNRTGAALTLTAWKPVYIKCAPQSDGSAIIDANNPYVQDLPATADGKIYIFLGVATSATQVEVVFHHPVYYHDGTRVTNWPGVSVDSIKSSIGDIQTALDTIIGKSLIEFKIRTLTSGGYTYETYQAEDGMTWEDWINSEYNTNNFIIFTGADTLKYISQGSGGRAIIYGQDFVRPVDAIIEDGTYDVYMGIIED